MASTIRALTDGVLGFLFPDRCVGCGRSDTLLCPTCRARIRPYPDKGYLPRRIHTPLEALDEARAAYLFEEPLREAIHAFKYTPVQRMAPLLGDLLIAYLRIAPLVADALIPVPLHPHRLHKRGFNQSALLAHHLSHKLRIPLLVDGLLRVRDTTHQVELDAQSRQNNMQGAFTWNHTRKPPPRVILLDDVLTTGATLGACAQSLRTAGSQTIYGLALAHSAPL